jgi:DNA adenine methylase
MAPHEVYVEPFAGGAGVLLRKPASGLEVYNDLNEAVVTFFRVLRERPDELIEQIRLTPYSRVEWERAFEPAEDPIERARRFYVRSWQSYGSTGHRPDDTGWQRLKTMERGKTYTEEWNETDRLRAIADRMSQVQIEKRDAMDCITEYDGENTLFYLDPPYLADVRERVRGYEHDMDTREAHRSLAASILDLDGMVLLSGYPSEEYYRWYEKRGWKREQKSGRTMEGSTTRTECLWMNPALVEARGADLFHATPTG